MVFKRFNSRFASSGSSSGCNTLYTYWVRRDSIEQSKLYNNNPKGYKGNILGWSTTEFKNTLGNFVATLLINF